MLYRIATVLAFMAPLIFLVCAIDWILVRFIPDDDWQSPYKW